MTDIVMITHRDDHYPASLRHVQEPPTQLYIQGNIALLHAENLLAVVGSRKASGYGAAALKKVLTPAVAGGIPLVSGLAYGVDSMAHRLCLREGTPTIAVLGSGLDDTSVYPQAHLKLAREIVAGGGALVSEYAPGTPALLHHFPARNRIIAGLGRATMVVQAAARSGSLITARLALEGGKDVLAIPGAITDPLSLGTNKLIREGATPIVEAQDVLDYFQLRPHAFPLRQNLNADQQLIFSKLSADPQHVDDLVQETHLPSPLVATILVELEMIEVVQNVGGMKYIRS